MGYRVVEVMDNTFELRKQTVVFGRMHKKSDDVYHAFVEHQGVSRVAIGDCVQSAFKNACIRYEDLQKGN